MLHPRILILLLAAGCAAPATRSDPLDPAQRHVPLPGAHPDWRASLVLDNGDTGVWTVKALPVFPQYATSEVVGLDDDGRCWVMVSYSGKWTPFPILKDGSWLGGLTQGDLDLRIEGGEVYTGGKAGNLYQVHSFADGGLEGRRIARYDGHEIHTLVAGEWDPRVAGPELLVFTRPGALFRVRPSSDGDGFDSVRLQTLNGRIRDVAVLDDAGDGKPALITASRNGRIELLRIDADGPQWTLVHELGVGRGRLAVARASGREGALFYSSADDGRVFRHQRSGFGWESEVIYHGPQGTRGLAAGRFCADSEIESLAVFGYSGRVELLTRHGASPDWTVETLFTDRDKGHWLGVGEFDGRNNTDELLASGYGGRIVLLARPAGYGKAPGPAVREK